jgi:predicted NBD/HSP70 family sugar kinase
MNQNTENEYSFGIDLNSRKIVCILMDVKGTVVGRQELYAEMYRGMDYMIDRLYDTIIMLSKKNGIRLNQLSSIGVALPSIRIGNEPLPYHFADWAGMDLRESLSRRTGVEVYLASYGAAAGISESWQNQNDNFHKILALDIFETMVSAAFVVDERVYSVTGHDYLDVGHFIVDFQGVICTCGKQGCLDVMGTGNAATRYYEEITRYRIGMGELKRRVQNHDQIAMRSFDRCAQYISMCILNLLTILGPDKVCLGGDFILENEYLFKHISRQVRTNTKPAAEISLCSLKENSEAYGAGIIALKHGHIY